MTMEWYRMYHGMPFDTKLRVISRRSGQAMGVVVAVWTCLLDAASMHDPRGVAIIDSEEIAVALDLDLEVVESIRLAMCDKQMLDEDGYLTAWDKRQRTTSTERSKKSRLKKKGDATDCNAVQQDATTCNSTQRKNQKNSQDTDKDTETDKDSDKNKDVDKYTKTNKENRAREEKREFEREKQRLVSKNHNQTKNSDFLDQMLDIWNEEVQSKITKGQKAIITAKRKELLSLRFIDEFAEDIRAWRYFCEIIGKSEFCLGKIEGKDWTIDLTWAIQSPDRIAKILEGGFSGGKHPPKPSSCELPEFQDAWDDVLKNMTHHHGQPAIRGWFSNTVISSSENINEDVVLTLQCPCTFVRDWIEKHYLADLKYCWEEQVTCSHSVVGIKLTIKEK